MMFRIIMMLGGLILAVPIILLNVWGMKMSMWTNDMMSANEAVIAGEVEPGDTMFEMPQSPWGWWQDRTNRQETFDTTTLTDERTVTMTRIVSMSDILAPGEAVPEPVYHTFYMTVRAPGYMIAECAAVLQVFASQCDVLETQVIPDQDGKFKVSATLAYLPTYPLGNVAEVQNGEFITANHRMTMMGAEDPNTQTRAFPEYNAEGVNAHLTHALEICAQISARFGNCIISSMSIDEEFKFNKNEEYVQDAVPSAKIEARTGFTIFAPETATIYRELQAALDEMAPVLY